jgi:hypothetical protein
MKAKTPAGWAPVRRLLRDAAQFEYISPEEAEGALLRGLQALDAALLRRAVQFEKQDEEIGMLRRGNVDLSRRLERFTAAEMDARAASVPPGTTVN